jgi:energy-coupling factor transport system substrate-specific component
MGKQVDWLGGLLVGLCGLIGVVAFGYPFFLNESLLGRVAESVVIAPLLTMVLLSVCLLVLLVGLQGEKMPAKSVAMLGVLVATTSVLRFIEVAIPGPGGFSPIFAPIILAGYVFGGRFGFLLGALTLLVSGLVTGGIGPWLPYQMFAAGWVGLTAGWLPFRRPTGWVVALLAVFGFLWGLAFGFVMNLTFYPFAVGDAALAGGTGWEVGLGFWEGVGRYLAFYAGTSFLWDLLRGVGNVGLIWVLGVPGIRALVRFRDRFGVEIA